MRLKFFLALLDVMIAEAVLGMSSLAQDSASTHPAHKRFGVERNAIEVRSMSDDLELEYRHGWFGFFSTELFARAGQESREAGIGTSMYLLHVFFAQGAVGLGEKQYSVTDVAPFSADYILRARCGMLLPLGRFLEAPVYLSLSGGKTWFVQRDYCVNCGYMVRNPGPPRYEKFMLEEDRLQLGFGVQF